ncbi:hypothetical protein MTO96_027861 [Rhipicephalus appendiculatus]
MPKITVRSGRTPTGGCANTPVKDQVRLRSTWTRTHRAGDLKRLKCEVLDAPRTLWTAGGVFFFLASFLLVWFVALENYKG